MKPKTPSLSSSEKALKKKPAKLSSALTELNTQLIDLSYDWDNSKQERRLIEQLKHILLNETIFLDSALCLGLGSLEKAKLHPLLGRVNGAKREEWWCESPYGYGNESFEPIAKGRPRSAPLYQLLVFESVLEILRKSSPAFHIRSNN